MRQHLTVEEVNELGWDKMAKMRKLAGIPYFRPEMYTIGVLQAILLEAGYGYMTDNDNSIPDKKYVVTIWVSGTGEGSMEIWTNEPVEVYLQAVKELVLKGVE